MNPTSAAPIPSHTLELLAVDARKLAQMLNSSVRVIRSWDAAGKLPTPVRIGGKVLWNIAEIRAWLDAGAPDRETWTHRKKAKK